MFCDCEDNIFYQNLKGLLKIFLFLSCIFFLLSGFVFFNLKIDKTNVESIYYCPSCGYDLRK